MRRRAREGGMVRESQDLRPGRPPRGAGGRMPRWSEMAVARAVGRSPGAARLVSR
uniref:Uncharacterized protein n=1 Tax=Arcella intermedia TaxID=1963864 RepID=A0A6B2LVF1_9EUKA